MPVSYELILLTIQVYNMEVHALSMEGGDYEAALGPKYIIGQATLLATGSKTSQLVII